MATETLYCPKLHPKGKLRTVCDENTLHKMTPSLTKKRRSTSRSGNELREINRKTSTSSPETVHSSSKKKRHMILSDEDTENEFVGLTPGFNASSRCATPVRKVRKNCRRKLISDSDSEEDGDSSFVGEIGGTSDNNCNGATVISSSQNRRSARNSRRTCKHSGTTSAEKLHVKKSKALEELITKRSRRKDQAPSRLQPSNLVEDDDDDIAGSFHKLEENLGTDSDFEDSDSSQSQELLSEKGCTSESDLSDFVVDDDSQSQNMGAISFYKPSQDECYEWYIQMMMSSVLDNEFLSSLEERRVPHFEEARRTIDGLIETKKNAVEGKWKEFKKMLEKCTYVESKPLPDIIKNSTCQACNFKRHLSEALFFYDEKNGTKVTPHVKKFTVGCYCAERGHIYHDLHHHDVRLKEECLEKIHELKSAIPEVKDNVEIVEYCMSDEEWLEELYRRFQSLLGVAEDYGPGGKKRGEMQRYCREVWTDD